MGKSGGSISTKTSPLSLLESSFCDQLGDLQAAPKSLANFGSRPPVYVLNSSTNMKTKFGRNLLNSRTNVFQSEQFRAWNKNMISQNSFQFVSREVDPLKYLENPISISKVPHKIVSQFRDRDTNIMFSILPS